MRAGIQADDLVMTVSEKSLQQRGTPRTWTFCISEHLNICARAKSPQSSLTLCDPMDCRPPGSSVHGILQARILEWVAVPSSRGLPNPGIKPSSLYSCFTTSTTWEALKHASYFKIKCPKYLGKTGRREKQPRFIRMDLFWASVSLKAQVAPHPVFFRL